MLSSHKQKEMTISIAIFGKSKPAKEIFPEMIIYIREVFKILEYDFNYMALESDNYKDGKIKTVNRFFSKAEKEILEGNYINSLEFYSLPENYNNVGFDDNLSIQWTPNYMLFTFSAGDFEKVNEENVICKIKQFFQFDHAEIFKLKRNECPWIYVLGVNPKSFFKSLRIIKTYRKDDNISE